MNQIIPFVFEGHQIRVIRDENGDALFVGKDICEALGYADTTNAMKQHCRGVVKRHPIVDSLGRTQQVRVLQEGDMYRLMTHSKLESAERFESLVFDEILPTIRKTGKYEAPTKAKAKPATAIVGQTKAHLMVVDMMQRIGVRKEMAMAVALQAIHEDTGLTTEHYRLALPSVDEPANLNQTQIGEMLGLSSRHVGDLLRETKLMTKDESNNRILTKTGLEHGEMKPFNRNGHSGYEPRWKKSVLSVLTAAIKEKA